MSRSFKKHPVISIACCVNGRGMKKAKSRANRKVRRANIDMPSKGNYFRRLDERYMWPDDGKQWWDNPKAYRK